MKCVFFLSTAPKTCCCVWSTASFPFILHYSIIPYYFCKFHQDFPYWFPRRSFACYFQQECSEMISHTVFIVSPIIHYYSMSGWHSVSSCCEDNCLHGFDSVYCDTWVRVFQRNLVCAEVWDSRIPWNIGKLSVKLDSLTSYKSALGSIKDKEFSDSLNIY
jgi:hypothetical protein